MRHCLIVDDSDVVRKVAKRLLEEFHMTSTEAESAADAMEACRRAMPDVILLDWHTSPAMTSHDFMSLLRHTPGGDQPIVIYCTTDNDHGDITRARQNGANEILMKPFDKESMGKKLRAAGLDGIV